MRGFRVVLGVVAAALVTLGGADTAAATCVPTFTSPHAEFTAIPTPANPGDTISFDASTSSPGSETTYTNPVGDLCLASLTFPLPINPYAWNFDDGTVAETTPATTSHAYTEP